MLWPNSCPRCSIGAVEAASDHNGRFLVCLSCGWIRYALDYGHRPVMAASAAAAYRSEPERQAAA